MVELEVEVEEPDVTVDGADIRNVRTINSMYANNNVIVTIKGLPNVRIKCHVLLEMMKYFTFDGYKARKYVYLEEAYHRGGDDD